MRKILLFTLCALFSLGSVAQTKSEGVNWEHGTLAEALNKAKNNKKGPKLVFLDCFTTWCGPCKQMTNNVFPTKEAGDYFNKNFVNIKIDMEKGEGVDIAKKYSVAAYPTFLILDGNGDEVGRVVGGGEIASFIKRVEAAKDIKNSPKYVKQQYDANKTSDNAIAYLEALENSYMNAEMGKFFAENLSSFKPKELLSQPMWKYFSQNLASDKALLDYVLENKAVANSSLGQDMVDQTLVNTYFQNLMMYLMGRKELTGEEVKEAANVINLLAGTNDNVQRLGAEVAVLYADKNIEKIGEMYKFMNFASYGIYDLQTIERIFGGLKEISKEQVEQYYKEKADFLTKQAESCTAWKDMFLKSK